MQQTSRHRPLSTKIKTFNHCYYINWPIVYDLSAKLKQTRLGVLEPASGHATNHDKEHGTPLQPTKKRTPLPSQQDALTLCWFIVRSSSATLAQQWTHIESVLGNCVLFVNIKKGILKHDDEVHIILWKELKMTTEDTPDLIIYY